MGNWLGHLKAVSKKGKSFWAAFCLKAVNNSTVNFRWVNSMKNPFTLGICALLLTIAAPSFAQQTNTAPAPTPYTIVHREANERTWQRTTYEVSPSGKVIPHIHIYKELATGLCYQPPGQNGEWLDSQEVINILPDGSASATNGQHQAYFPANIANGKIKLVTPDGAHLQSQPIGLSYDDGTNTVLIGELSNSVGELISSNQVLYPNAFAGLDADLLYTYRKSGFEQDVVFRAQPPAPEQFGFDSANTKLQLLTEFFNPPSPAVIELDTPTIAPAVPMKNERWSGFSVTNATR